MTACLGEALEGRRLLAVDPLISEFQAINRTTVRDADGEYSDWIELYNSDTQPLNLDGWYLTDDKLNLTKWQLPTASIGALDFLTVFASGKDRRDPVQQLHANFDLDDQGEYLAIVRPDGITIAQSYDPYPPQYADQSYGVAASRTPYDLLPGKSPTKALVPTDASLGATWIAAGFDDSAWINGTTGVGYEELIPAYTVNELFDSPLSADWSVEIPAGGTGTATVAGGALRLVVPAGQFLSAGNRGTAPIVYRTIPNSTGDFELVTTIAQGSNDRGGAGIVVTDAATGLPAVQLEYQSRVTFRLLAGGTSQGTTANLSRSQYSLRLVRDARAKTWTGYYRLDDADPWTEVGMATDGINDTPIIGDPRAGVYARGSSSSAITARFDEFNISVPDQPPAYGPEIGLNVQAAMQDKNSSVYVRMPFTFTGDPAELDELALTARYDDGFIAYLNGAELTRQNVPLQSAWNSVALSSHGAVNGQISVQQIDVSAGLSALVRGQNVLAVHAMNVAPDDLDMFFDAQLLGTQVVPLIDQFMVTPTPGSGNSLPAAPTPQIGGDQGTFFGSTLVTLTIADISPHLEIHYTLDGTDPTRESPLYTGPLALDRSAMLQARTFDNSLHPSFVPSNPAGGTFIAIDPALESLSSDLPLMILDSIDKPLASTYALDVTGMNVVVLDTSAMNGRSSLDSDLIDYLGRGGAREYGEATAGQPKPYIDFQTWGSDGNDPSDADPGGLLGMAPDTDWMLHAPYSFDAALIRHQVAYALSNQMGMWAPHYRNVEVYFNRDDGLVSPSDYAGVYVLMEKVEQGPHRIDVADISNSPQNNVEPNISGGYIWKIDRLDPNEGSFSAGGQSLQWVYPRDPDSRTAPEEYRATAQQEQWVIDYFNEFAATLENPDINDPNGYSKFIHPEVWVDQHLLNVWMMNVEALRLGTYLTKDRGERLKIGPQSGGEGEDSFSRSAESNDDRDDDPLHWRARTGDLGTDYFGNGTQRWWGDLFQDPGFWQLYVDRWQMWRKTVLNDENVGQLIDGLADEVRESAARNIEKWSASRPRRSSSYRGNLLDGTYQGEINNMKKWLQERARFMDENFTRPPRVVVRGRPLDVVSVAVVNPGESILITGPEQRFFSDETLVDGAAGATTAAYLVPADDSLGDAWTATGFDDGAWNRGPLGLGFDSGTDFTELIKTQVSPNDVVPGSTTLLVRVPFEVVDLNQARQNDLVLKIKYDDGFVAYLNGHRVLDRHLRDTRLAWNSRANTRLDSEAVIFEEHDLSQFTDFLVQGTNVLAIRAINGTATSNDMLVLPELVSREVTVGINPNGNVYYTTDGSDPRDADGQPSASATLLPLGQGITINQDTRIIARNFDDTDRGPESRIVLTDWSGPIDIQLRVAATVRGDFDGDGVVNQTDIQLLFAQLGSATAPFEYDLTSDGLVNADDRDELIRSILNTGYGDANLDQIFDSRDLLQIAQLGEYEDQTTDNSMWSSGDWDGDGEFTSADLVLAFQSAEYQPNAARRNPRCCR
jgi:hypothetical protein